MTSISAPSSGSHELICGPTGSGKTHRAKLQLAEEHASAAVESWVVDPFTALPEWRGKAHRYAHTFDEIRALLEAVRREATDRVGLLASLGLTGWTAGDPRHGLPLLVVTVDDTPAVLKDPACHGAVEDVLYMARRCGIRFRLVVPGLLLACFGGSEVIRSQVLIDGSVLACQDTIRCGPVDSAIWCAKGSTR